ncbi:hypothetical protein RKD38_000278 [Streptomyces ambofaciens]
MAGGGRGRQGRPAHPGALTHAPPTGSHWEREPIEERKSPQVKSSCHGDGGCVLGPLSATDQGPQDVDTSASKRELAWVQGEPEAHRRRRPEDSLETPTGALRAVETTRQEHESAAGPLGESLFRDGERDGRQRPEPVEATGVFCEPADTTTGQRAPFHGGVVGAHRPPDTPHPGPTAGDAGVPGNGLALSAATDRIPVDGAAGDADQFRSGSSRSSSSCPQYRSGRHHRHHCVQRPARGSPSTAEPAVDPAERASEPLPAAA